MTRYPHGTRKADYVSKIGKATIHPEDCDHPDTEVTETVVGPFVQCVDCRKIMQ